MNNVTQMLIILTHLAYRVNAKNVIYQTIIHSFESETKTRASWRHYCKMTSVLASDGVTAFLRLKDVLKTRKRMWHSPTFGGKYSVQWRKVGNSCILQMCFRCLLCVRIEIDQLLCVDCWVIIHCLSVSCAQINKSCNALVIWSSLSLSPQQWIITQQFTARADLFHKKDSYWLTLTFST